MASVIGLEFVVVYNDWTELVAEGNERVSEHIMKK